MTEFDYDFFVIGGGSGGVRAARRVGGLGKKVGLAEEFRMGGTCVIRGCVPKKLFVYASHYPEYFEDAKGYGFELGDISFDWHTLMSNKDQEIKRLEGLYRKGLESSGVEIFDSRATLVGPHEVKLHATGETVTAAQILVATGGFANSDPHLPGAQFCINSNGALHLDELPKTIVIAGGGYIAVEFANIFHGLGVETTLIYRGEKILRGFDDDLRDHLQETMVAKGVKLILGETFARIEKLDDGRLEAILSGGGTLFADKIMMAIGRSPNTHGLGLEHAGVETNEKGAIIVDDFCRTNMPHIWAVGDVIDRVQLTPVAIHEAMCLMQTAFLDNPTKPDYDTIPTAVFSQPEIGTVGLPESKAAEQYSELEIYRSVFRPMKNILPGRDEKMLMKLIVDAESRVVVGAHIIGPDAGEMAQLLGISLKARCTKEHFDATMALHPSAAEELVTMYEPSYRVKDGARID